jgi:hypothetical protein
LTVVASLSASVELVTLDPGQTFKHLLSLRYFKSFEKLFSSSQKLPVIVKSVSQAHIDLVSIGQTLRKHLVGCCNLGYIDIFLVEADHEADAQEVEGISISRITGCVLLVEPLQGTMRVASFPVLVHPNSSEEMQIQKFILANDVSQNVDGRSDLSSEDQFAAFIESIFKLGTLLGM